MSACLPFLGGLCGLDCRDFTTHQLRMCPCQQTLAVISQAVGVSEYNQNFKMMLKTVDCDKTDTLIFNIIKNSQ